MADTFTWTDLDGERRVYLDDPADPGARYLAVRRLSADDDWGTAFVLERGAAEQQLGDGLPDARVAEDMVLKLAIQGLARLHGVSPAPGLPGQESGEAEVIIMKLWGLLTARWAPPPGAAGDEGEVEG